MKPWNKEHILSMKIMVLHVLLYKEMLVTNIMNAKDGSHLPSMWHALAYFLYEVEIGISILQEKNIGLDEYTVCLDVL